MEIWRRLQTEQAAWALRNFGVRQLHWPLLGIVEELGELDDALGSTANLETEAHQYREGIIDAMADTLIFTMDFCTGHKWWLQDLLDNRVLRDLDATERGRGFLSLVGELCHAQLKQEQGIRGSIAEHDAKMQLLVVRIFTKIERMALRHDINLAVETANIWDTIVSKRDFTKNKQTGVV